MTASPQQALPGVWLAAVALVVLVSLGLGFSQRGAIPTDTYSERNSLREARALVAGEGRFGIYEYTHYPNGPIYVVAALMGAGLEPRAMRGVPIACSALALGAFTWLLLARTRDPLLRGWTVALALLVAVQPGVAGWMGALHEHAYALALFLVGLGFGAALPARFAWAIAVLGFVAGWTGFDWLPGQALGVATGRGLQRVHAGAPLGRAVLDAGLDGLRFASGACLAILAHLGQLALFFGSVSEALRDLLGSAAVRMGEAGGAINPEYAAWLAESEGAIASEKVERLFGPGFDMTNPAVGPMLGHIFTRFVREIVWLGWALAGLGVAAALLARAFVRAGTERGRLAAATGLGVVGAVLAAITWSVLMPRHAVFHAHILHRHFLMAWVLLLVLPVVLAPAPPGGTAEADEAAEEPAAGWAAFAVWSLAPLALLAAFVAAWLGAPA